MEDQKKSASPTREKAPQKYIFEIVSTRYNNEPKDILFKTT